MPVYERGDVRIHYDEAGSGFPLLAIPGGGLQSRLEMWPRMPFNALEVFADEFRVISLDQRNSCERSTGPLDAADPWGACADDHLGLLDHLGVGEFAAIGLCIGGPFLLKLAERAPDRLRAAVLSQPVGAHKDLPDVMYDAGLDGWAPLRRTWTPTVSDDEILAYLHGLYRTREPEFVYSVPHAFVAACQTPLLVMPDDVPAHPLDVAMEVAAIAPHGAATRYPWKDTPEHLSEAMGEVRRFLTAHTAGRLGAPA